MPDGVVYNSCMKNFRWLACSILLLTVSCQPQTSSITILDGGQIFHVTSTEEIPLVVLTQNGFSPQPADRILLNGQPVALDQPFPPSNFIQLQLRRAVDVTLVTPQGEQALRSSAFTVGQALSEAGFELTVNDRITPPAKSALTSGLVIQFTPAREVTILGGGTAITLRTSAQTVGEALAEAGTPLVGLDTSSPLESEAIPPGGPIRVVRVRESVSVALEPIPFEVEVVDSVDVAFGEEETLQPGVDGIAMVRTRIRYEDGVEVSRETEDRSVMREPVKRIVASGSKIVLAPAGGEIPYEYWYATEMYASVYSPCASGTGGCSYGTASGARAGYGIVAVDYSIYSYLAGMQVYIPGYGLATIGDTGGGPIIETAFGVPRTKWIDLGFNEGEMRNMTGWVTVYFLAPAPAEVPYFLK